MATPNWAELDRLHEWVDEYAADPKCAPALRGDIVAVGWRLAQGKLGRISFHQTLLALQARIVAGERVT